MSQIETLRRLLPFGFTFTFRFQSKPVSLSPNERREETMMGKPTRTEAKATDGAVIAIAQHRDNGDRATKAPAKGRSVAPNSFRLGYLIHDVSRMRRTLLDQHMKPEGITRSQWWVLANLSRHESEGVMTTELARLMDVGKVALGGLIDRLEMGGYVYRRPDKTDKRAKKVYITIAGYALIERMREIVAELNRRMSDPLTDDEISITEFNLIRIKDKLRELIAETNSEEGKYAEVTEDRAAGI